MSAAIFTFMVALLGPIAFRFWSKARERRRNPRGRRSNSQTARTARQVKVEPVRAKRPNTCDPSRISRKAIVEVRRNKMPFWEEHGWRKQKNTYTGKYKTPYGRFDGQIVQGGGGLVVYIRDPPREIQRHPKRQCFAHRGDKWFQIHLHRDPQDVSAVILGVQTLLTQAFTKDA